jgi:hypothetical protein
MPRLLPKEQGARNTRQGSDKFKEIAKEQSTQIAGKAVSCFPCSLASWTFLGSCSLSLASFILAAKGSEKHAKEKE